MEGLLSGNSPILPLLVALVLGSFAIEYAFGKKIDRLLELVLGTLVVVVFGGWMACSIIRLALVYFNLWPSVQGLFR